MEITEVRIKLIEDGGERLHAFCSITLDDSFVVRDLKIIEGTHGPFVAMPSRKLTAHCHQCGTKNHLRSAYCNHCGSRQKEEAPEKDEQGRPVLYADIAHPINSACREMIQQRVIREYQMELKRAKMPGYVSRYDDIDGDGPPAPRGVIADGASSHVPAASCHVARPHARRRTLRPRMPRRLRAPRFARCGRPLAEASLGLGQFAGAAQDSIGRGIAVRPAPTGGLRSRGRFFDASAGWFRRRDFRVNSRRPPRLGCRRVALAPALSGCLCAVRAAGLNEPSRQVAKFAAATLTRHRRRDTIERAKRERAARSP